MVVKMDELSYLLKTCRLVNVSYFTVGNKISGLTRNIVVPDYVLVHIHV